ncbi:uncharacterized protein B0T23DRAFT_315102 [Neurospora hispaniola]|uniref:Uncharacterized protein n=1 Tax=Neurospora hispaniola TaxID=588809 RepID=A0AAJ0IB72_9PEZI|nr:hypothetical protein B0T23DRAFT_315102 [Neurospora hispaniola]
MDSDSSEAGSPSPGLQLQATASASHSSFNQNAAAAVNSQFNQAIPVHLAQHATPHYPHFNNTSHVAQAQADGHQGNASILSQGPNFNFHQVGGVQGNFGGHQAQAAFSAVHLNNGSQPVGFNNSLSFNQPSAATNSLAANHAPGVNQHLEANPPPAPVAVNQPVAINHAQEQHPAVRALFAVTQLTAKEERMFTSIVLLARTGASLDVLLCSLRRHRSMTVWATEPSTT